MYDLGKKSDPNLDWQALFQQDIIDKVKTIKLIIGRIRQKYFKNKLHTALYIYITAKFYCHLFSFILCVSQDHI